MIPSLFIFSIVFLVYACLLFWMAAGYIRTPFYKENLVRDEPVCIIICAHNEEKKIGPCLQSILQQNYDLSKIQIVIVDDGSIDTTVEIAQGILAPSKVPYKVLSNADKLGKKICITSAMARTTIETIILRDADTYTLSTQWLSSIMTLFRDEQSQLIIAPVGYADGRGLLWSLQIIENRVLSVLSCGSTFFRKAFLSQAANLAFTRSVFREVNGYAAHIKLKSGDDVLLLEDIKKTDDSKISFIKSREAIVYTYAKTTYAALFKQRIRWASKYKHNPNILNKTLAFASLLANSLFLFALACLFFEKEYRFYYSIFLFAKVAVDSIMLLLTSNFMPNKKIWLYVPLNFLIYPFYALVVGISSILIKPSSIK